MLGKNAQATCKRQTRQQEKLKKRRRRRRTNGGQKGRKGSKAANCSTRKIKRIRPGHGQEVRTSWPQTMSDSLNLFVVVYFSSSYFSSIYVKQSFSPLQVCHFPCLSLLCTFRHCCFSSSCWLCCCCCCCCYCCGCGVDSLVIDGNLTRLMTLSVELASVL